MVSVRCLNKSYTVNPAPMSDVEAVIETVSKLAMSEAQLKEFDSSNARLMFPCKGKVDKGRELERGVPWRYLNVPSSASLILVTGLEVVLGAHDASAPASTTRVTAAAVPANSISTRGASTAVRASPPVSAPSASQPAGLAVDVKHEDVFLFGAADVEARAMSGVWDDDVDYEVTERDAMLLQSGLAKKSKTLVSGALMTQRMRDEERRRKLASLSGARIRIEGWCSVGDGSGLIVEFVVPAAATLEDLHAIVRHRVLESPTAFKFKLLDCTPPRKTIEPNKAVSMYEAGLWPAARLAIDALERIDGNHALGGNSVEDVFAEALLRRKGVLPTAPASVAARTTAASSPVVPVAQAPSSGATTSRAPNAKPGGVPKWFLKK